MRFNPKTETFFENFGATKVKFGPKRGRKNDIASYLQPKPEKRLLRLMETIKE